MTPESLPTSEGWWARHRDGRIDWFHVESIESEIDGSVYLAIFVSDMWDYVPVEKFSSPLVRWAGPITLPWW